MNINEMTKKQFEALPLREWDEDIGEFESLVFLPTRRKHDSGYRCIDFVAVRQNEAVCRLSGCSDVLHIGGISSVWDDSTKVSWNIDCLPKSGLFRLFCNGRKSAIKLTCGSAISSFEVFAKEEESKNGMVE